MIREDLLYYVWKTKSFDLQDLKTLDGQQVYIEDFGMQNPYSGPDFSNSKIKIGDTLWVGNVEMHINSSDWIKHNHQYDNAYQNVILHVVLEHDKDIIFFSDESFNRHVPTIVLKDRIAPQLIFNYKKLQAETNWIPCEKILNSIDISKFDIWKYSLAVERIELKTDYISHLYEETNDDWESVMYMVLARYFGGTANAIAFEALARSIDRKVILKNAHQVELLEALFFGQSGIINTEGEMDEYQTYLLSNYNFLKNKYHLQTLNPLIWKFSGVLPSGFPTLRIAQLVALFGQQTMLFSKTKDCIKLVDMRSLFRIEVNDYWQNHFTFGKEIKQKNVLSLSNDFIDRLLINAVFPVLFLYGKLSANDEIKDRVVDLLDQVRAERNTVISQWSALGFKSKSALDTQSLIHLKKHYCDVKKCLSCRLGMQIMNQK